MIKQLLCLALFMTFSCSSPQEKRTVDVEPPMSLTIEQANFLAGLPLKCIGQEFPNKLSQTLGSVEQMGSPKELHPAFYGCFDWHSSLHGHWMLLKLLKEFPELDKATEIRAVLNNSFTEEKMLQELAYFQRKEERSYERTYGWAWLLKLAEELHTWDDADARKWEANLEPLTNHIVTGYKNFLPKLLYPLRNGTHTNTGFGLAYAWDFANTTNELELKTLIEERAKDYYLNDVGCPLSWEPSGTDFLSPCLEEIDIMRRVLPNEEFKRWLNTFLPELTQSDFTWEVGKVADRSDGHLVHLDGVNYSRAWTLYGLVNDYPEYSHLNNVANAHLEYTLPSIVDGEYAGEHWLASFAIYALTQNKN